MSPPPSTKAQQIQLSEPALVLKYTYCHRSHTQNWSIFPDISVQYFNQIHARTDCECLGYTIPKKQVIVFSSMFLMSFISTDLDRVALRSFCI